MRARVRAERLLLVALALAAPARGCKPADDAASLVARHVAWLGGREALERLHDLRIRGRMRTAGLEGEVRLDLRRDGYLRSDYDLGAFRIAHGLAGEDAWVLNASGQVEDMGRRTAIEQRRELDRWFSRHLLGSDVTIQPLEPVEREDRSWPAVRFAYPDGDAWDLLVDADGRAAWARETTDTATIWYRLDDWREVGGVRFPFRVESFEPDPAENASIVLEAIVADAGLDAEAFARPAAGPSVARIADGAAATDWSPLDFTAGPCICTRGTVNGTAAEILLDSGAGITVIEQRTAARAGLVAAGSVKAEGVSGSTPAGLVGGVTIALEGLEVGELTAATIDLARANADLEVILGKEVFHNLVVDVDYPNARVRFHDPARFAYDGPGRRVPIEPAESGHRQLELRVEELPAAIVEIDTGSNGTLDLFRVYTDENGLLDGRAPVSERLGAGVGGTTVYKSATLRSITFAGHVLREVPVSFHRDAAGAYNTRRLAGNLGTGVLSRFRVVFDYAHGCLWVEPGAGWDRPFERDGTGLQFEVEPDALRVVFVAPGSPAAGVGAGAGANARAEWKVGDRIVEIDGVPVGEDYWKRVDGWNRRAAGTVVRLKTAGGEARELVLARYD
jgi:hypothetical protein